MENQQFVKEDYPYQRIYEQYNFTCQYCGWRGDIKFEDWYIASLCIDHIRPKSAGGSDDPSNLVVSCHACNLYKGSISCESLEEAKQIVDKKRAEARMWYQQYVLKGKNKL